jgi:GAF domain-containing protein
VTVPARRGTPALLQVDAVLVRLSGRDAVAEICRFLRTEFPHFGWFGVYRRDREELVLVAYSGDRPTEHVRIPISTGLCGQAVREGRTVIAGDVRAHPEYLACFVETRSEIVVPIRDGGAVVGEIDIDGNELNAFDATDEAFLVQVARRLPPHLGAPAPPSTG